jgi:hypothetical protein
MEVNCLYHLFCCCETNVAADIGTWNFQSGLYLYDDEKLLLSPPVYIY